MESMINTVSISSGANMTDRRNARVIPAALGGELNYSNVVDGTISVSRSGKQAISTALEGSYGRIRLHGRWYHLSKLARHTLILTASNTRPIETQCRHLP